MPAEPATPPSNEQLSATSSHGHPETYNLVTKISLDEKTQEFLRAYKFFGNAGLALKLKLMKCAANRQAYFDLLICIDHSAELQSLFSHSDFQEFFSANLKKYFRFVIDVPTNLAPADNSVTTNNIDAEESPLKDTKSPQQRNFIPTSQPNRVLQQNLGYYHDEQALALQTAKCADRPHCVYTPEILVHLEKSANYGSFVGIRRTMYYLFLQMKEAKTSAVWDALEEQLENLADMAVRLYGMPGWILAAELQMQLIPFYQQQQKPIGALLFRFMQIAIILEGLSSDPESESMMQLAYYGRSLSEALTNGKALFSGCYTDFPGFLPLVYQFSQNYASHHPTFNELGVAALIQQFRSVPVAQLISEAALPRARVERQQTFVCV